MKKNIYNFSQRPLDLMFPNLNSHDLDVFLEPNGHK